MMNDLGLYIHIPFCIKKCSYCDFYSLERREDLMEDYAKALIRQMETFSEMCAEKTVDSVYIGGGTPSIFPVPLIQRIFGALRRFYHLSDRAEVTIEANPATVNSASLSAYRAAGINRISFGVQSSSDALLEKLGRLHGYEEARVSILLAKEAGFDNISADLMYALPGQEIGDMLSSVEELTRLPVTHLSVYGLKIEKNTPFGRDETLVLPEEEQQCQMYFRTVELLLKKGFWQYEISNFSKKGYESRHNLKYWTRSEYLGFGPAAHSFLGSTRFFFPADLQRYIRTADFSFAGGGYAGTHCVTGREAAEEEVMLSLRTVQGCALEKLSLLAENRRALGDYVEILEKNGYARIADGRLILTPSGMLLSNTIISDLLVK